MEYSPSVVKSEPQTSSHLMLGYAVPLDVMDPETGSCQLGNLMLFKGFLCLISLHSLALLLKCVLLYLRILTSIFYDDFCGNFSKQ